MSMTFILFLAFRLLSRRGTASIFTFMSVQCELSSIIVGVLVGFNEMQTGLSHTLGHYRPTVWAEH